jgi:hypothetical protein
MTLLYDIRMYEGVRTMMDHVRFEPCEIKKIEAMRGWAVSGRNGRASVV